METITVFGSARPEEDSADYRQALLIGEGLARRGYTVATGGYSGTMAAVSQGASRAGGHVIGVTTVQLDRIRAVAVNPYVKEKIVYDTLLDRMLHLVRHNVGMIALPGGIGTLAEVALAWEFMRVAEIEKRPLILVGGFWRNTMDRFVRAEYVSADHRAHLKLAESAEAALILLDKLKQNVG